LLQRRPAAARVSTPAEGGIDHQLSPLKIGPAGRQGLGVIPTELIEQMFEAVP
jgi:hypothetical protein